MPEHEAPEPPDGPEAADPHRDPDDRHRRFRGLMPHRVRRLLLLASSHDAFLLDEDGRLDDLILSEFLDQSVADAPWMTRISTGERALDVLERHPRRYDCVIATSHVRDMHVVEFARAVRLAGLDVPVAALAFDLRELDDIRGRAEPGLFDRLYAWQGDSRLLPAIVKSIEDRWNVAIDTKRVGVSSIILIEDSVRYYSSFLPKLYGELLQQSQRVIAEGMNLTNKLMRLRARPKILHATCYEDAVRWFRDYERTLLGVVTDVDFPRANRLHAQSGIEFALAIRETSPDLPILLQTHDPACAARAEEVGASFLLKNSPVFLEGLSHFVRDNFGFGDFVFRLPDGTEAGRVRDLRELETMLRTAPAESIRFHAERNHFSAWLRARTEFGLAERLHPRRVDEFSSIEEVRTYLADAVRDFRFDRLGGVVSVYERHRFEPAVSFSKIGGGSLGGKARGIAWVRRLLRHTVVRERFPGIRVVCPAAVVLATDLFDEFLDANGLRDFALQEPDDAVITRRFLESPLPEALERRLPELVDALDFPIAVRSSSLLEDSQRMPFAGIYGTYMVSNSHPDRSVRTAELRDAIRRVYATTFTSRAKAYIAPSTYRPEEEKMAVIVQRLFGARHGSRFYPDFAGVARSHNYYAVPPMAPSDGIVSVALGLGEAVVAAGRGVRFSPLYPRHPTAASTENLLDNAQTEFYALDLDASAARAAAGAEPLLGRFALDVALADGTLAAVASTWSPENDAVYDGLGRPGVPVVTFAPVLKHGVFPLAEAAAFLLDVGSRGLNMPVEIEFAVNLSPPDGGLPEMAVLQVRPHAVGPETDVVEVGEFPDSEVVCRSGRVLGNGRIEGILDLVVVGAGRFDRSQTARAAAQVARLNAELVASRTPYVLVGVGRWGASDPWLGVPVRWEQIAGASVIVEAPFRDLDVAPSQGSHFFHNLTASRVGFFTVASNDDGARLDWAWLANLPAVHDTGLVRHVRLAAPLRVLIDGRLGRGVVLR